MSFGSGDDPELLHEAEIVLVRPLFGELAVLDPMDDRRRHLERVASLRDARKVALVHPTRAKPRYDPVALRDLILDRVRAGGRLPEDFEGLLESRTAGRESRNGGGE